jgi:peptidoglycan hydrolase-like protein with peptidoglycan-binding domain
LTVGLSGSDVTLLQEFLVQQNSGPYAQKLAAAGITGYFGHLTKNALVEFQAKVGISPANGYFGPKTRAYIDSL